MTSVGDYDLEHQIGAGASGTVWKAHRRGPVARVVALKRLRAGSGAADLARMRREATVLTELDHPHVVRVLEVLHDGDGVAIAMQFAPGGSLADLLAERGRLAPGQVVAVAAPVADALASAHRRGVLHGDVKPANILFTSDGEPLLGDFGVARTLGPRHQRPDHGHGRVPGPRAARRRPARPARRRLLAGVVCYQALTGRPPYTGAVPLAVARAADAGVHERLEEVAGVPEPLARVVEQAMDRDPARRFAAADEMARALRATVPAGDVRVPGPATMGRVAARRRPRRRPHHDVRAPAPASRARRTGASPAACPPRWWWPGWLAAGGIALLRGPLRRPTTTPATAPRSARPGQSATAQVVRGDVDGDGCAVAGVYQPQALPSGTTGMVLTIPLGGDRQADRAGRGRATRSSSATGTATGSTRRRCTGGRPARCSTSTCGRRSSSAATSPTPSTAPRQAARPTLEQGSGRDPDCDRVRVSSTGSDDTGAGGTAVEAVSAAATPTGGPLSAIMEGAGDTTAAPGEGRPAGPWEIRSSNRPPSRAR